MSEATETKVNQCAATRRDGHPCTAPALASGYCFAHDPALAQKRATARANGGKNRAGAIRLHRLCPPRLSAVYAKLETALVEVHDGKLDPKVATAMAALARAMVAVLTSGQTEERLRAVEEMMGQGEAL